LFHFGQGAHAPYSRSRNPPLRLGKDVDPDISILTQAQAKYGKLL